jgi:O-antigen ligase
MRVVLSKSGRKTYIAAAQKVQGSQTLLFFKAEKDLHYLDWLVTASVVLLPVLALTVKGGANACLYLLVLASLISVVFRWKSMGQTFFQLLKKYWYVHLSMAAPMLAIFAHQLGTGSFNLKSYDIFSRMGYFALMAWVLLLLPSKHLKHVQWGIVAGSIAAAIKAHIITGVQPPDAANIEFLNRIPYGDMALMLGILSFLSIGWSERKDKWAIALKVAGGCAGLYTSYLCQARGGWVALPVFAAIGLAFLIGIHVKHKLAAFGMVLVLLGTIYGSSSVVQDRINVAADDVMQYRDGVNQNTSIGIRIQHWHGSWILFSEHPIFGVGKENFYPKALHELYERNIISKAASLFVHPHSEFFFSIATLGIFGLIAFWALHLVPTYFFFQAAHDPDQQIKTAGSMGLALFLGFFVYGLTEVIFFTPVACAFFGAIAAALFASVVQRKQVLENQ